MKRKLLSVFSCLALSGMAWAQTAWTGDITNANGLVLTKTGFNDLNASLDVPELWTNNAEASFNLSQEITGLPEGVYKLSVNAMYRASYDYGTPTNCILYATTDNQTFTASIPNFGDFSSNENLDGITSAMTSNNAYSTSLDYVVIKNGTATIGMKSEGGLTFCNNGYWFVFRRSSFTFRNVTEEVYEELKSKIEALLNKGEDGTDKKSLSEALTTYSTASADNIIGLRKTVNAYISSATAESPVDATLCIVNPSFEGESTAFSLSALGYTNCTTISQPNGWNLMYSSAKVGNTQWQSFLPEEGDATDGSKHLYIRHRWGDVKAVENLHQSILGMPKGVYKLTVSVKGGASVTDANTLSLTAGDNTEKIEISGFNTQAYEDYSVVINKTNDEDKLDICYGLTQQTGMEQLYYIDNFRLTYYGDAFEYAKYAYATLKEQIASLLVDETYSNVKGKERSELAALVESTVEDSQAAYEEAKQNLEDAIETFKAAKTNYDALAAEIVKAEKLGMSVDEAQNVFESAETTSESALKATQQIKVDKYKLVNTDYSYGVELGAWTTDGSTGSMSGQHWSDDKSRTYLEQSSQAYGENSWNIKYAQDLLLPAGKYVFMVAGRKVASDNCTLKLVVTNNSDKSELGSVDDFPEGDTGLGINKKGETSFDAADEAGFANSGKGRGWGWRYVPFTLDAETSINIAVTANATAKNQWVSFCDATVQTNDEVTISMIAYNIALRDAKATLENDSYQNVTGSERTALQNAISANPGTTSESIKKATATLNESATAFTTALSAYNDWSVAKGEAASFVTKELPYAATTKYEAISTAIGTVPQSATEATDGAATIRKAYRAYIESNALAEGVEKATDETNVVANPLFENEAGEGTLDKWTHSQGGGNEQILSGESFTDSEGKSNYHYYDYNNDDNNVQYLSQNISGLTPGKYLLTVTARGAASLNGLQLEAGGVTAVIPCIGNRGGQFGRGWNDVSVEFEHHDSASDVTIGVRATQGSSSHKGWFGFTRVRLVRLADMVTMDMHIDAGKYATRIFPFAPDFSGVDVKVFSCGAIEENKTTLNLVEVETPEANKPYILYSETGCDKTVSGINLATGSEQTAGLLTGVLGENKEITSGYVLQTLNGVQAFYAVSADDAITVPQYRAYLTLPEGTPAEANALRLVLPGDDDATAISEVVAESETVDVYSLSGVLVRKGVKASEALNGLQKGIYVVNGVKKAVK